MVYTVTFKSNYGTNTTLYTRTVTAPAINVVDFPANPTRTDYAFTGWNTQADGLGSGFSASTTVTGDTTVFAQWVVSYTITFNNDGGDTAANPATKAVTSPATTIDVLPVPPAKTGYNFGGWYTDTSGGGTEFTDSSTVSSSITVYARWDIYSYTVTFDKNGGDTEANPTTKTVASPATTINALPTAPGRTDYAFAGWNTEDDGSGDFFTASTTVSGNIRVYALWTTTTITLNPDAGDGAFSQGNFTLSKPIGSQTISIAGTGYTDPRWLVDGSLKGTEMSITLSAAEYGLGGHSLTLLINKGGVTWSKDITFTVTN